MPYQEHSIPRLVLLFFLSDQSYHPQYYISGYFDLFQTKFLSINGCFFLLDRYRYPCMCQGICQNQSKIIFMLLSTLTHIKAMKKYRGIFLSNSQN